MLATVPFVLAGVIRLLSSFRESGECPTKMLLDDVVLQSIGFGWLIAVLVVR